tara:strand:- start:155 stop:844 length:690 start_codon:yes stop_codon:yes gene_type:complete
MPNIYANTNDGYVTRFNQSTWSDARANTTGTAVSSTSLGHFTGVRADEAPARGGGTTFSIYRSFFYFDTSAILRDVSSATFKVRGYSNGGGDLIAVKSTSDIETLGTADFNSMAAGTSGSWQTTTDGSGGGDNTNYVTAYSAQIELWNTGGYNDIDLNAQALADMRDDDTVYICLLNYDYDLLDIEPTGWTSNRNGLFYSEYSGTSRDPYITYTLVPAADNSIFFGANF